MINNENNVAQELLAKKLADAILAHMNWPTNPVRVYSIETEGWGENFHIPVPPKAKGKRVRISVDLME